MNLFREEAISQIHVGLKSYCKPIVACTQNIKIIFSSIRNLIEIE